MNALHKYMRGLLTLWLNAWGRVLEQVTFVKFTFGVMGL